eukprot:5134881-Alexandrium_andersonii.AAC.1
MPPQGPSLLRGSLSMKIIRSRFTSRASRPLQQPGPQGAYNTPYPRYQRMRSKRPSRCGGRAAH